MTLLYALFQMKLFVRCKIDIFNIYPKRTGELVAYERLPQSELRLYTEMCKLKWIFIFLFSTSKIVLTMHDNY